MATKQLSIVVKAIDEMTAPFRAMAAAVGRYVDAITSPFRKMFNLLTSVRALIVAAAVALASSATIGAFNGTAQSLDEIGKTARRLGMEVETFSSLKFVAEQANVGFEAFAQQISTAEKNLGMFATTGGGKAAKVFKLLKVDVEDTRGNIREMSDLLPELADRINALPSSLQRQYAASAIFGDSSVLNVLGQGGDALRGRFADAARLGNVFTEQDTRTADEYASALGRVRAAWFGVKVAVVREVAPALTGMINTFAYRVAEIPATFRAIADHTRQFFAGGQYGEASGEKLRTLAGAAADVMKTTAIESGKLFGIAAIEAIIAGVQSAGTLLADSWNPLADTTSRQLARARDNLSKVSVSSRAAAAYEFENDAIVTGRNRPLMLDGKTADQWAAEVTTLENKLRAEQRRMASDIRETWSNAFGVTEVAAKSMMETIEGKLSVLRDARDAMLFVGPPEPEVRKRWGSALDSVRTWANGVIEQGKRVAGSFDLKQILGLVSGKQFEAAQRDRELSARQLGLAGDDRGAERMRMAMAQAEELRKAQAEWLPKRVELLRQIQSQELNRFDLVTTGTSAIDALTAAEEAYSEGVTRRAALVQAGTIGESQATRANITAAASLRDLTDATLAQIRAMQEANPELAKSLETFVTQAQKVRQSFADTSTLLPATTFMDGVRAGLREFVAQYQDIYQQARQLTVGIATTIGDGLTNAFTDVVTGTKNVAAAFRDMASSVLRDISRMIIQLLVFRTISSIAGGFLGGGRMPTATDVGPVQANGLFAKGAAFRRGSVVPFANGTVVGSPTYFGMSGGRTGLMGEKGPEAIMPLTRGRDGRLGVMANGGSGGTVVNFHQTVNVAAGAGGQLDYAKLEEVSRMGVVKAIEMNPTYRARVRGALA